MTKKTAKKWTKKTIAELFELPFTDLLWRAQQCHRQHFDPNAVQISTLISIKTGACPEDCAYCPQSGHYQTGLQKERLLPLETVIAAAKKAKAAGATRFCMGAAWRGPSERDLPAVIAMIKAVKALGLETCGSFGLLRDGQAQQLKAAGLDYYNHNLDSSPEFYQKIITTRTYEQRLHTLQQVSAAGINVCCGGIVGMGESREDRVLLLEQLISLEIPPKSVPINILIPIPGTPLHEHAPIDPIEFVRTVAVARLILPNAFVRLSAGRNTMSDELHALSFLAGANSIHYGEKLFVTPLPETHQDQQLLQRLGMHAYYPENFSEGAVAIE